jgi:uncharacterized tellurite resistance protein B-like protein
MEIAELFALPQRFDPSAPGPIADMLVARFRGAAPSDVRERLAEFGTLTRDAAGLVAFATDGCDLQPDALAPVHELAVLALAVDRSRESLLDPGESVSNALAVDLEALGPAARAEIDEAPGPLSSYVLAVREALQALPGWTAGEATLTARLADLLDGLAQEYRMRAVDMADAFGPSMAALTKGAWLDVVVEAACIAAGDDSRNVRTQQCDLVSRLASGVIGLARDLGDHLRGDGTPASTELIAQRFAIPAHVIRLAPTQIARSLRATLELEVRDLLDAVAYLDGPDPRAAIVRRTVAAMLALDGSAHAVASATDTAHGSREELMDQMRAVARADGKITAEERALLRGLDAHLLDFQGLVARIEEDRKVDFDEFEQLRGTRHRILDDMFRIALADNAITDDERQLLLRAMELLPVLRSSAQAG